MAQDKKVSRLGTGLSALFGEEENILSEGSDKLLPVSRLEPRKDQPRRKFDEDAIADLARSIQEYGLIQPITVRPLEKGYYQIIAGERRWRAAREAGLKEVPVRIIEADDLLAMELALVENLQREDLNPMEEALGYQRLSEMYGLTQEEIAAKVQKSRPAVANSLRLLGLDGDIQKMVYNGELSAGHARALLAVKDVSLRQEAAREAIQKGLNVRQTETLAVTIQKEKKEPSEKPEVDYVKEAEKTLSESLGREVRFSGGTKKGCIRLSYYSADDREALMDALMKMDKNWKNTNKR